MVKIFSNLRKTIKKNFSRASHSDTMKSSKVYWSYDNIKLKRYFEIIQTGNISLMARSPLATPQGCAVEWEKIIKKQDEISGSGKYSLYFNLEASQGLLLADYIVIKATLMKISLTEENIEEDLKYLKSKGYNINLNARVKSINAAIKRSDNLITRIMMKESEIKKLHEGSSENVQMNFQDVLTDLNFALGWNAADENITLAAYNRFRTLLKQRNGRNNNTRRNSSTT